MRFNLFTTIFAVAVLLTSCGSGSKSSDSMLFGSIPDAYLNYEKEIAALLEKAQTSTDIKELENINQKGEALKANIKGELEQAAQAWSGSTLDISVGEDLKIVAPVTVTFDGFANSTSPKFALSGDVETTKEINANYNQDLLKYYSTRQDQLLTYGVLLVGLDEQGQEVVSQRVGSLQLSWANGQVVIAAGTKVKFDNGLAFRNKSAEAYLKIKSLSLKVADK